MATINDASQARRLDTHAASTTMLGQDVSTGEEPYLAGPGDPLLVAESRYGTVAKGIKSLFSGGGDVVGRALGPGRLSAARERLKALQDAPPEVREQVREAWRQPAADRPGAAQQPATRPPAARAPVEITDEGVAAQSNRLPPRDISGDRVLADIMEPHKSDVLLSDGVTDFTVVGSRGDAKIPDEGNIYALIQAQANQLRGGAEWDDATRGVITQEASEDLANVLGMHPERLRNAILNRKDTGGVPIVGGNIGLPETLLAARNLLYSELNKLDQLADMAGGTSSSAEDLLNFRQQLDITSQLLLNMKGIQTEIGRSLGVYRYPIDPRAGAGREMDLTTIMKEFGGEADMRELLRAYRDLPVGAPRAQFIQRAKPLQRFTNALYEWWINILLSSPITHVKNFGGAMLTTFGEIPVGAAAATIGSVRRGLGGEGGVTFGDVYAEFFGQMMSMSEAFSGAAHAARTGEQVISGSKLTGALGAQAGRRAPAISAEAFGASGLTGKAVDILGTAVTAGRVPLRALEFEDTYWKIVAQRGSLWKQAWREARNQNLSGDEAAEFMAAFMHDPPAAALQEANDLARKVTLQEMMEHEPARSFKGLSRWGAMRWAVPFIKTPYNALKFAVEHSPAAFMTKPYKDAIASGDRVRVDTARARMALGYAGAFTVGGYAASGQVTGGGPRDPGRRAALYRQGWRPYSVLVGGEYYSYHGAEPYSTIVGVIADMVEIAQTGHGDHDALSELGMATVFALGKNLTNKTFMQGFNDLVGALADPDRHAKGILQNFVRSAVPRAVATWNKSMDEQMRAGGANVPLPEEMQRLMKPSDLRNNPEFLSRFAVAETRLGAEALAAVADMRDQLVQQIPGWSSTIPARRDLWGNPVLYAEAMGPNFMSPIYKSAHKPNEIDQELFRLKFPETGHPDTWEGVPLNGAELEFFQKRAGEYSLANVTRKMAEGNYKRSRAVAIATNQPPDSDRNQVLRYELRTAIAKARHDAFRDLKNDPTLGPTFRAMMRQHQRMGRATERRQRLEELAARTRITE